MLLITYFPELGVLAGKSQKLLGRQHAVSERQLLIHTYHANRMLFPCRHTATTLPRLSRGLERSLSERHIRGMAGEWRGNGIVCVNETWPHCVNHTGKTHSEPLAERHGR
jgi:hypothetical protein